MEKLDCRGLKAEAGEALGRAPGSPDRLALYHALIAAAAALLVSAVGFALEAGMNSTGGLSGLGTRKILGTAESVLQAVLTLVTPFWSISYAFLALSFWRGQQTDSRSLLEGFRRFAPVLRFMILGYLIMVALTLACFYPSMLLFLITPLSNRFIKAMVPLLEQPAFDPALLASQEGVVEALLPFFLVFGLLALAVMVPVFYRFRLAEFAIMDHPEDGAFAAFRCSSRITRRRRTQLFKLDLSFWWFYLLQILAGCICYGDLILGALGVDLGMPAVVSYFLFYVLGLAAQVLLFWKTKNYVMVTYAAAYEELSENPVQKPAPMPRRLPDRS